MAGPLIGGRRPISWRLAIVVSFVAGQISGTVSFLVLVGLIGATWWINSRAGNRRNELLGSAASATAPTCASSRRTGIS